MGRFRADTVRGEFSPIGDPSAFDWVARLCSNRRLRFIAGGFELPLVPPLFSAKVPPDA